MFPSTTTPCWTRPFIDLPRCARTALFAALMVVSGEAWTAEAVCRDYNAAVGEDRALFNGFVYGYVSAKMEGKGPNTINAATHRVTEMTGAYCAEKPNDQVQSVVALFAITVAKFGLDPLH